MASDDDTVSAAAVRWCRIEGLADIPLAEAVRTGDPVFLTVPDDLDAALPAHARAPGVPRHVGRWPPCPCTSGTQPIGGLLLSFGRPADFDANDQAFLAAASAAQVTQAMKRALKFQVQQTTSELLQRSLMPESIPDLTGLAMGAYYEPGGLGVDVGGDWYDVIPLADGRVAVALGDVMGKGVPAAIVMGQVRAAMRAYALIDPAPGRSCSAGWTRWSTHWVRRSRSSRSSTASSTPTGEHQAGGGRPPAPLLATADGGAEGARPRPGPPLGLSAGPWEAITSSFPPDTPLLFFSDGLVETPRHRAGRRHRDAARRTSASSSTAGATRASCAPGSPRQMRRRTATTT